jgi:hypothetical protein
MHSALFIARIPENSHEWDVSYPKPERSSKTKNSRNGFQKTFGS